MPAIVEFPAVVTEALAEFGDLFANEPERRHFAEYLTGLLVAERKNVSSISRQFAQGTDQSRRNGKAARKTLVTNRTQWEIGRILRVYRHRWRGTECFHRDGKQHPRGLGMGDCQLRKGRGQTRHMYLVFLAHSVLMRQLRRGRARAWALQRLTTIGQACRAALRETLSRTIDWVIAHVTEHHWNARKIKAHLALA